jgi:hypothetical protein
MIRMELFSALGAFILLVAGIVALREARHRTIRQRVAALNPGGYREVPVRVQVLTTFQHDGGIGILFLGPSEAILGWRRTDFLGLVHWTQSRLRWDTVFFEPSAKVAVRLVRGFRGWAIGVEDTSTDVVFVPDVSRSDGKSGALVLELLAELRRLLGKEPCLLAVGELGSARRWLLRWAVTLAACVLVLPLAFAANQPAVLATCLVVASAIVVWQFLARGRTGRVAFYPHTIDFIRQDLKTVFWREIVGYRDDSADYIQLLREGTLGASPELAVPTRTEAERVAVLALLDSRGLKRMER